MFQVETITSFDDPRLAPYRNLRRQYDHAAQEIFVAEGDKVVHRLLESNLAVISVLLPTRRLADFESLLNARSEKIPVFAAEMKILENLTGFSLYQGVLAAAKIPRPLTLTTILQSAASPRFFAAVDGLSNAENIGILVRNCAAFGVQALILGETCSIPYLRRAVRISMGTIFKLPHVQVENLAETLRELRRNNIRCIAADPHADSTIFQADFSRDCCLVFGSEGSGISQNVKASCEEAIAIPMHGGVDSLNVGNAAAVFLYEAARQRANHASQIRTTE